MRQLTLERERFSEIFSKDLTYVDVEEKADYNDKTKISYYVTVMSKLAKGTLVVQCEEPLPREIEYGSKIDFERVNITFKGKGVSTWQTNILAELLITTKAKKCIMVK